MSKIFDFCMKHKISVELHYTKTTNSIVYNFYDYVTSRHFCFNVSETSIGASLAPDMIEEHILKKAEKELRLDLDEVDRKMYFLKQNIKPDYYRYICKVCDGTGMVQIAPNVRGIKKCDCCNGVGYFDRKVEE